MTTTTKDQQEAIEKAEKAISLAFNKILIQQPAMLMFLNHADLKPIFKEGLTVRINTQSSIMNAYLEYNPDFINTIEDNSVLAYILGMEGLRIGLNHVTSRRCNPIESLKLSSDLIVCEDKYLLDTSKKEVRDLIETSIPHIMDYEDILKEKFNFNKSEDFYLEKLQAMFAKLIKEQKQKQESEEDSEEQDGQGDQSGDNKSNNKNGDKKETEDGDASSKQEKGNGAGEGEGEGDSDGQGQGEGKGNTEEQQSGDGDGQGEDGEGELTGDAKALSDYFSSSEQASETATAEWGENEMFEEAVKETANRVASDSSTWGNLSPKLIQSILLAHTPRFDPRKILRRFAQSVRSTDTEQTRMKMNRRKGFDYPGKRKLSHSRVLFAIDSSGSMSDEDIEKGLKMLKGFLKHSEVSYCFWDGICSDITKLNKRDKSVDLVGRGMTNPQSVIDKLNDERHKFDGIVYFTDAQFVWDEPVRWGKKIFCITVDEEPPSWVRHKMTRAQVLEVLGE